jgi:serine/threonine-protein kinase
MNILSPEIPGYEVLEQIGEGGMAVVFRARHVKLNRIVALKLLRHGDDVDLARFQREAQTLAAVQHPHVVQVFDSGRHQERPFIALEFVAGGSLDERLRENTLSPHTAAKLLRQIALGVHAVHQQNLIHRDLKPANVLITPDETAKVTDFGLARRIEGGDLTRTGVIIGTPSYMAPEQARGQTQELSVRVDVYGLGSVLYECITGQPPFRSATVVETLIRVQHEEPVPPRKLQPSCPRDLETICLKCLSKEPAQRYGSAQEVAEDLERFLSGQPIQARPSSRLERGLKWVRRNPVPTALALVVLLTLIAAGVWLQGYFRQQMEADQSASLAMAEARSLHEQSLTDPLWTTKYHEAVAAAERAKSASDGGASAEVRRQVKELQTFLLTEERAIDADRLLFDVLLDVRNPRDLDRYTPFGIDDPPSDDQLANAFRQWGIDVDQHRIDDMAARIKKRPAAVQKELIAALDEWAAQRRRFDTDDR